MDTNNNKIYGLRENLAILFRYQQRIKTVFFCTILVSLIGSFLISKVYESDAKILVQNHREAKIISTSNISLGRFSSDSKERLFSEIQIFTSSAVLEKTVSKLKPDYVLEKMRWRWDWLQELPGKIKESVYDVLWSFPITENILLWLGKTQDQLGDNTIIAKIKILDNLTIEPIRGSNVFEIILETPDPDFSALAVNTLVEMYQEVHLNLRQGVEENQIFSDQVTLLKKELYIAKKELLQLKHDSGVISVDSQINLLLDRISAIETQKQETQLQNIETKLQVAELERQLNKLPKIISLEDSWSRNPDLNTLTTKLSALQSEKNLYVENSVSSLRLNAEIDSIKKRINNEVSSIRDTNKLGINPIYQKIQGDLSLSYKKLQGLKNSYSELEKEHQKLEHQLVFLDTKKILINEKKIEIERKEHSLSLYTKKQEENKINLILNRNKISNVTPIEYAVPPISASKPNKIKNLILGMFVGLSGGLLIAYISEFLRRSLSNKEEVESFLGLPCFAAFRLFNDTQELKLYNQYQSKMLSESITMLSRKDKISLILISSARPKEGKSMVASNLATSLIEKGAKVLLLGEQTIKNSYLDFDNTNQNTSQIIISEDVFVPIETSSLIFTSKNKKLLSNMIKNKTMTDLDIFFNQAKEKFDFIIIDSLSLSDAPESIALASIMDGVIFVVEAENTSRISIVTALSHLKQAGAIVLGVVLNKRTFVIPQWAYNWFLLINKT